MQKPQKDGALQTTTTNTEIHKKNEDLIHKLSDEPTSQKQPKENSNFSSTRSSGTSTLKQVSPNDWQHKQDPHQNKQSTSPKIVNYELQVKENSTDSGHSSPSSSLDKEDKDFIPIPLSEAKPRTRPKSQFIPKSNMTPSHRFSFHDNEYHKQNSQISHNPQVYRVDNITYADLDPKAFMIPQNKVLPSRKASSSDSRSTYAEISISKSQLV